MKYKCQGCGKCCLDTEMMLSKKDINTIIQKYPQDLQEEDFVLNNNDLFQLKNVNGHCIFFDMSTKMCKIYSYRPQGCKFYPLTYDKDKKTCVFDEDCPRTHLFYQSSDEFGKTCKQIQTFLREYLEIEL